ncbi:MAG: tRNA-dihydrouridine synthase family protein [Bacteroidales bacterium]|nr:tRNA-dihydrouridine synthase family protein [Bacteroidales bacterium]
MDLVLAPMQGLTEVLFRRVYEDCFPDAFDRAVSPFLSLTHGDPDGLGVKLDDILPKNNAGAMPVVPQLLGNDPRTFVALANRIFNLGYEEVNWNLGCPVKRVAHRRRGSGLLPYPSEIDRILEAVVPRMKPRLSVKIRLGYNSKEEIYPLIPVLNKYPLASVTLHPRIGKQMYTGVADVEAFGNVFPLMTHPVVYNGDIATADDYENIAANFPALAGVMIGRGVFRNPLLPLEIKRRYENRPAMHCPLLHVSNAKTAIESDEKRKLMLKLLDAIETHSPSHDWQCRKAKEYWALLADAYHVDNDRKRSVLHCKSFSDIRRKIIDAIQ